MKNSTILFLGAALILVWFGSEAFTAQEICVTSCVQFPGASLWEEAVAVAILPVLMIIGAFRLRRTERLQAQRTPLSSASEKSDDETKGQS
jgi:membrane protein implicated in regulation of membrane protease activity